MMRDYQNRGYPHKLVKNQRDTAENMERRSTLIPRFFKQKQDRVPLILTYNPVNPPIMGSILKHWEILHTDEEGKEIFKEKPLLAHRRCPNLRDKLVQAKLNVQPTNNK